MIASFRVAMLTNLFAKADKAGYGIANGPNFEAYPGLENAAADYIESLMEEL